MKGTRQNGVKVLTGHRAVQACGLALLVSLACLPGVITDEAPTPQPTVGVDALHFSDPATGARFREMESCLQAYVDDTWRPRAYRLFPNSYQLQWCRGTGTQPECRNTDPSRDTRDIHSMTLFTRYYHLPEVYGLGVRALWVPETTGWKASFSFFEGSEREGGDGWGVTFIRYDTTTGRPDATLELGDETSYKVIETLIRHASEIPVREDLARFLAGPEALRDQGQEQIRALAEAVREAIDAGQVPGCDWTEYQGRGIPPACISRPMTPAEQAEQQAEAEAYFAAQEGLLQDHYQEMVAAWMDAFPFERCWKSTE